MADTIVYRQSELEAAIAAGAHHITLCAGVFNIPKAYDISFDRIGPVKVTVECSRREADAADMRFEGIYPQYKPEYETDTRESPAAVAAACSGSGGSFAASGSGGTGSFAESFRSSGSRIAQTALACIDESKKMIRVYGYGIDLI